MIPTFEYRKLPSTDYEIKVQGDPKVILEAIARASYETARIERGKAKSIQEPSELGFSGYVHLDDLLDNVLSMKDVRGKECNTYIHRSAEDIFVLGAWNIEQTGRNPVDILEKAKVYLSEKFKDDEVDSDQQ